MLLWMLIGWYSYSVRAQKYQVSYGLEPNFCTTKLTTRPFGTLHNFGIGTDVQLARPLGRFLWLQFGLGYDHLRYREYFGVIGEDPLGNIIKEEYWKQFRVHDLKFPVYLVGRIPVSARFWAAPSLGVTLGIQLYKTILSGENPQFGRVRAADKMPYLDRAYATLRLGGGYTLNEQWILFVEPSLGVNVRNLLDNYFISGEPFLLTTVRTSLVHTFGWEPGPTRRTLLRQQRRKVRQLE